MLLRQMEPADIPLGMQLKNQAGWNQTRADWERFLDLEPEGCFVAEWDGQPVGTTTTCVFGSVGWIAMVLVRERARHRGIGTRLVERASAYLDGRGVKTVRLDATPLGKPVYAKMGFVVEHELVRLQGVASATATARAVVPVTEQHVAGLTQLDRVATGTDRRAMLNRLLAERPPAACTQDDNGQLVGFALLRAGSRATQLGPAAAIHAEAGRAVCDWAVNACSGDSFFVDIPLSNRDAMAWAHDKGLHEQRRLTRMFRGVPVAEQVDLLWASSGPEKG
jgi:GNAT superfamily N-acetyltransferase